MRVPGVLPHGTQRNRVPSAYLAACHISPPNSPPCFMKIDTSGDERTVAIEQLKTLGLTTYGARTFVALHEIDGGTAKDVAAIADVPRTRVRRRLRARRARAGEDRGERPGAIPRGVAGDSREATCEPITAGASRRWRDRSGRSRQRRVGRRDVACGRRRGTRTSPTASCSSSRWPRRRSGTSPSKPSSTKQSSMCSRPRTNAAWT